ncbi:DegV family protein [Lacticaseibacillus zhaodongensis]|uniref:DegV family protein n=1 Tax=Lacticaseibacillus zhaodongensis TaxID=2668065 RepID=UPI0012D2CB9D|nr:DegV family protein [Lacticaseibacillus zhaodongensis]
MKIAIVTDSTAYLTPDQIKDLPIRIVTTPVILDDVTYNEGEDITPEEFYKKMAASKDFPHTSQPRLGDVLTAHKELLAEGYDTVINIYLSATISGIHSTISAAARNIKGQNVIVYDSQITIILLGEMVRQAGIMAKAGASVTEITDMLDKLRATTGEYFVVNDLQHLVRGGRLSSTAGFVGGMLRIKPVLTIDDQSHKIVVAEKIRTINKAYARIEELFAKETKGKNYPIKAWVVDAGTPEEADRWLAELQAKFPKIRFARSFFGPAITTHIGAGSLALAWIADRDQISK